MAYDEAKDACVYSTTLSTGLQIGVFCYDGGEPKLQFGPRIVERNGKQLRMKAGRLSFVELKELADLTAEIKQAMIENRPKEK